MKTQQESGFHKQTINIILLYDEKKKLFFYSCQCNCSSFANFAESKIEKSQVIQESNTFILRIEKKSVALVYYLNYS